MAHLKSEVDADADADAIVDTLALLESQLAGAPKPVLKALRRRLMAIYAEQMLGSKVPPRDLPDNQHREWSLNHTDLMKPIRDVYLNNYDLDFNEDEARKAFPLKR